MRLRFPMQVVDAVVKVASRERVGLRISTVNPYNDMKDSDPKELFTRYSAELAKRNIVYLHVLEALPGHFLHAEGQEPVLKHIRESFPGTLIVNGGYDLQTGNKLLETNGADAIAFGTLFIANPDLVERSRRGAKLNSPDAATFYTAGAEGYTDYPFWDR